MNYTLTDVRTYFKVSRSKIRKRLPTKYLVPVYLDFQDLVDIFLLLYPNKTKNVIYNEENNPCTLMLNDYISIDPRFRWGNPCVNGIEINMLLERFLAYDSVSTLIRDYPSLNEDDIEAVLRFYLSNKLYNSGIFISLSLSSSSTSNTNHKRHNMI